MSFPTPGAEQRPDFSSAHWMAESISAQFLSTENIHIITPQCIWSKPTHFFHKIHFICPFRFQTYVNLDFKPLRTKFQFTFEWSKPVQLLHFGGRSHSFRLQCEHGALQTWALPTGGIAPNHLCSGSQPIRTQAREQSTESACSTG